MSDEAALPSGHPAPHRHRAGLVALGFGLGAAPLSWAAQSVFGYALSSHACFPGDTSQTTSIFAGVAPTAGVINLLAIAVAIVGMMVASRSWRATRAEQPGRMPQLLERGEGRTRFLAMCGVLTSGGFLVATIFTSVAILLVPACRP